MRNGAVPNERRISCEDQEELFSNIDRQSAGKQGGDVTVINTTAAIFDEYGRIGRQESRKIFG